MAKIVLDHLTKKYPDGNTAVKDLCLTIEDGEFVVLVGPSGCGKSTTLRMIAGLEEPTGGDIFIGEDRVNGIEPRDRNVAMVFQSYALYGHMTVYDNMAFSLKLSKMPKEEIDRRVREIAEILGITRLLKRKPRQLSGGECQRVALGRALVREPKVFLFDEPLSNLDAKLRTSMRSELIRMHEKLKTTFVYVTHDQTEAMTMGDRIVVLDQGVVQQYDSPEKIYDHPDNLFTAGFIGTPQMNFLKAANLPGFGGENIVVGIRPEYLSLTECDGAKLGKAKVEFVELLGASMNVHARMGDEKIVIVMPVDRTVKRDKEYEIWAKKGKSLLFERETGCSLGGGR